MTRPLYLCTSHCILEYREWVSERKTGSTHHHMFVPDSRKNLFLCYSWLVIYIEHLIQMEAWKRAVIRADRNRWNTCFLLLLLLFCIFFFYFYVCFLFPLLDSRHLYPIRDIWDQSNEVIKKIFFLYYFDNVDFVLELSDMCCCKEVIGRNPKY